MRIIAAWWAHGNVLSRAAYGAVERERVGIASVGLESDYILEVRNFWTPVAWSLGFQACFAVTFCSSAHTCALDRTRWSDLRRLAPMIRRRSLWWTARNFL